MMPINSFFYREHGERNAPIVRTRGAHRHPRFALCDGGDLLLGRTRKRQPASSNAPDTIIFAINAQPAILSPRAR